MLPKIFEEALAASERPVCAYVYDTAAMTRQAARVRAALPAGSTVLYAMKANGHPRVVAALAAATDGVEVASAGELAIATDALRDGPAGGAGGRGTLGAGAGVDDGLGDGLGGGAGGRGAVSGRLVVSGPAKTDELLAGALAAGATVNVESVHELRRLDRLAGLAGKRATVAVRVNRVLAAPAASLTMTGTATPFGVDERELPEWFSVARELANVDVTGFHLHAMSNNLDARAHAEHVRGCVAWSLEAARRYGVPLGVVNVGGGIGLDYVSQRTLDLGELAEALAGFTVPQGVELVFELGRILAAEAGWYAAEVIDLKSTHGRTFAVLRGGTHHFRLPASWGYDHPFTVVPVEEWPYPWPRPEVRDTAVDAVGELCTPKDVLARDQPVSRLRVGDVLVFARTGAYAWDVSHHEFLRHSHPQFHVR